MSIVVVRQHRGVNCFTPDSDYDYSTKPRRQKHLLLYGKGKSP
jgi:hypothetical protein